jgi:hypothetical protein
MKPLGFKRLMYFKHSGMSSANTKKKNLAVLRFSQRGFCRFKSGMLSHARLVVTFAPKDLQNLSTAGTTDP